MNETAGVFDWLDLPGGRARFCGGLRGADQAGHEAFALELDGQVAYGEIRKAWTAEDRFDLEVVSFGHRALENIGMPVDAGGPLVVDFTAEQLRAAENLLAELVQAFLARPQRPFVMNMDSSDKFSGTIRFVLGWALVRQAQEARP